ncbi:MAG: NAD-dependent succinate-semialdehyde dehydrogenase, partial [Candidatus Omnitrophica bacterium]|nr:NAD-dependent succinate-semialdehyde dehydrogenase [Candidatus Omnitrophota bacterium]
MIESPLLPHHQNYIDGRWVDGTSGRLLQVINPATGELLTEIPEAGPGDAARAIES